MASCTYTCMYVLFCHGVNAVGSCEGESIIHVYVHAVHNTSSSPFFTFVLHKCLSKKVPIQEKNLKKASERLLHKRKKIKKDQKEIVRKTDISRFTKQKKRLFAPFAGSRKRGEGLYYYFLQKGEGGCCPGAQQRGVNKLRRSQDDGGQPSSSSSPSVPPNAKHSPPEVQNLHTSLPHIMRQ